MDFEKIKTFMRRGKYQLSLHAQKRMDQRGITLDEVKQVIYHGSIVEDYPEDTPYPSCLIVGNVRNGFHLYVVCALSDTVNIITVHWMDPEKWLDPKTRREKV